VATKKEKIMKQLLDFNVGTSRYVARNEKEVIITGKEGNLFIGKCGNTVLFFHPNGDHINDPAWDLQIGVFYDDSGNKRSLS